MVLAKLVNNKRWSDWCGMEAVPMVFSASTHMAAMEHFYAHGG